MPTSGKSPQPPLLFLGCLLLGAGLRFVHPLGLGLPLTVRLALGGLLLGLVVLHGGWGLLIFRRMGTTPEPNGVASALLTSGPFRWTRNPLYLGLATLMVCFGILLDSAWVLGQAPVLVLLLDRLVIVREEARLRAQFGEAYEAYARRVRRWL
ncbi:MAG: isoprenylcysteine carboxylmethyltransferase family protein [Holophagaceae bacterium]|nr:isoprenylcysteine carboxylmethyltransferase family protein [Holophagaceae bacterium]